MLFADTDSHGHDNADICLNMVSSGHHNQPCGPHWKLLQVIASSRRRNLSIKHKCASKQESKHFRM
eukprot:16434924-Heterocapsa_arctica.AAC.1